MPPLTTGGGGIVFKGCPCVSIYFMWHCLFTSSCPLSRWGP